MKPIPFLFLCAACAIGYAAYHHAGDVEASIADAAVDAAARKAGLSDSDCKDIGNAGRAGAAFVNGGLEKLHVSAPAANVPAISANDAAIHDELRGEIEALKSRVGTLERRKECTCSQVANAPAAPPAAVPEVTYEGGCADGQCGSFGGRFFGRRR